MSIQGHFRRQAQACAELGSPFMQRLLTLTADNLTDQTAIGRRLLNWPQRTMTADAVALRYAAALHRLVLKGADVDLVPAYPPHRASDPELWSAVSSASRHHEERILDWMDCAPQTNELGRAAGLIAAACHVARHFAGLPLRLSELGASAGLNLGFGDFGLNLPGARRGAVNPVLELNPDWYGPLPPDCGFSVADRRGVDLCPVDLQDPEDVMRLRSYIWADQPARLARTDAALNLARPLVDHADAADWLEARLATRRRDVVDLIYHTIAWQYFSQQTRDRCKAILALAARSATTMAPLAHLSFEADGRGPGAPLILHLWPGNIRLDLGRMDFHGRWIKAT